jgi:hypothetical protein
MGSALGKETCFAHMNSSKSRHFVQAQAGHFRRDLLPPARTFYEREFGSLRRINRGNAAVKCCFHKEKTPSLSLNLSDGRFFCFGCGAKGGDVIDFLQKRDGLSFQDAAKSLGAWDDSPETEDLKRQRARQEKERQWVRQQAESLAEQERVLRIQTRTELHAAERSARVISAHLRQLPPDTLEAENGWGALQLCTEDIAELDASYRILSFSPVETRARFILNEWARPSMVKEFIEGC